MRRALTAAGILGLTLALSACGPPPFFFVQAQACPSWVAYETDEERTEAADAVVVVTDIEADGTGRYLGVDANAHRVRVIDAAKGPHRADDVIRVISSADPCGGALYAEGDPMLAGETLRLFLTRDDEGWSTLTPFDGVSIVD